MPMFVDTSPPGQCIFCRLVQGSIPAAKVYEDALSAIGREKQIKSGSRKKKMDLVHRMNPTWKDLSEGL